MGVYVNPPDQSKESWLEQHGMVVANPSWEGRPEGTLPVCLVDNGPFKAAGVTHNKAEFDHFSNSGPDLGDYRPRIWYYVPVEQLLQVAHGLEHFLNR